MNRGPRDLETTLSLALEGVRNQVPVLKPGAWPQVSRDLGRPPARRLSAVGPGGLGAHALPRGRGVPAGGLARASAARRLWRFWGDALVAPTRSGDGGLTHDPFGDLLLPAPGERRCPGTRCREGTERPFAQPDKTPGPG